MTERGFSTNDSGGPATVYLIIDSPGLASCGAYIMTLQTDCSVGAETMSLGGVKAGYR